MNIKAINIESLRSQMSIVSQEPALFDSSFADNIAYGVESMRMESVENAAKMANIHDFIMTLPHVSKVAFKLCHFDIHSSPCRAI